MVGEAAVAHAGANRERGCAAARTPWHADPGAVQRFLVDFVSGEMAALRPGGAALPPPPWPRELRLDESGLGLGLDSLERLAVAAALTEALHLHDSGLENLLLMRAEFGDWLDLVPAALARSGSRQTFRSSGSSGTPKRCTHPLAELDEEVDFWADVLGEVGRVWSAVPAHHIYGFLFTVLLPARLPGLKVVDARRCTPQALQHGLRAGDWVIGHPLQWRLLTRYGEALPAGVRGVTSGAPCPDALAHDLERLGLAQLIQVYGSSETAGIGWRTSPAAGYRLLPFWARDPRDDGQLLRLLPDGPPRAQRLQDHVIWQADGAFTVGERLDAAVPVAGMNVYPGEVRRRLLEHPAVADAAVRLMRPEEGQRLKAFIVPHPGVDAASLPAELLRWAASSLRVAERPKAFSVGAQVPMDERGKLLDWPLPGGDAGGPL